MNMHGAHGNLKCCYFVAELFGTVDLCICHSLGNSFQIHAGNYSTTLANYPRGCRIHMCRLQNFFAAAAVQWVAEHSLSFW